jgi:hypothetical protein
VPVPGNLEIAFVDYAGSPVVSPTIGTGWTEFSQNNSGTSVYQLGLYRYVQVSDTASLPAFITSASTSYSWGYDVYEIGGVEGSWAADFQSAKNGQGTGATVTTTADTTLQANTLALVAEDFSGSSATELGFGGSWANDTNDGGSNYAAAEQFFASKGSTVQSTMTPPSSATLTWIQLLLGSPPSGGHLLPLLGVGN